MEDLRNSTPEFITDQELCYADSLAQVRARIKVLVFRFLKPCYLRVAFDVKSMVSAGLTSIASCNFDIISALQGKKNMHILCIGHGGGSLPLFLASKIQVAAISGVLSHYSSADWAQEGGDPSLPVPWSWVRCSSDPQPIIISILLSSKNLTGNIPLDITKLVGLVELWLDGNMLTGPIPDFTGCTDLKIINLENNQLTGVLPDSLAKLPSLREL